MHIAVGIVLLVAVSTALAAGARRFGLSEPLVLTLAGIVGSYLWFIPDVSLSPQLVLLGLLPPLLYTTAIRTSLVDFRANRRPIALLSVGLVLFSTFTAGLVTWWLLPVPFATAVALGAVVAPPDAVSATAVARRVGMPRRIVTILEGESLFNDATALVALRTAIAAGAGSVGIWHVVGDFALAAGGGIVLGTLVALGLGFLRRRITDPVLDTCLSFLAPFLAYLPAEEIHGSGVIAAVVCGLILGHRAPVWQSAASRIAERTNWRTIEFLLENSVFLLIGLQVRVIVENAWRSGLNHGQLVAGLPRRAAHRDRGPADLGVPGHLPAALPVPADPGGRPVPAVDATRPRSRGPACAGWSRWPRCSCCRRTPRTGTCWCCWPWWWSAARCWCRAPRWAGWSGCSGCGHRAGPRTRCRRPA